MVQKARQVVDGPQRVGVVRAKSPLPARERPLVHRLRLVELALVLEDSRLERCLLRQAGSVKPPERPGVCVKFEIARTLRYTKLSRPSLVLTLALISLSQKTQNAVLTVSTISLAKHQSAYPDGWMTRRLPFLLELSELTRV